MGGDIANCTTIGSFLNSLSVRRIPCDGLHSNWQAKVFDTFHSDAPIWWNSHETMTFWANNLSKNIRSMMTSEDRTARIEKKREKYRIDEQRVGRWLTMPWSLSFQGILIGIVRL
jgi:hypothetical protein